MAYTASNPNGQATGANSSPVVIASDQSTVKVKLSNDLANTTGAITTASTAVTATTLTGVGSLTISISGTYVGVNVAFEGSIDGTLWIAVAAQPLGTITPTLVIASGVLTTNSTNVWNIAPVLGLQQFRVRATAWTSGSAAVVISPSAQFSQYLVNVATMPAVSVSGTVTSTIAATTTTNSIGIQPTVSSAGLTLTNQSQQALTNTVVYVKAAAARLYEYDFYNPNTSGVWVQIINLASGAVLGTTVPVRTIYIPASSGRDWTSPWSMTLSAGLAIACTTTNTGSTAPASPIQAYVGYI